MLFEPVEYRITAQKAFIEVKFYIIDKWQDHNLLVE